MPKVTVYIRNDDYESWRAVGSKTQFISDALNNVAKVDTPVGKPVRLEKPIDVIANLKKVFPDARPNCKVHGLPLDDRNRCLTKGCRYA
jgi:hypothetical protein